MSELPVIPKCAPSRPGTRHDLVIHVVWDPIGLKTHVVVTAERTRSGNFYGPFEASCNCHSSYGPIALVSSAVMAWWKSGPLGLEVWMLEDQHDCALDDSESSE